MSTTRAVLVALLSALPQVAHAQYAEARPGARVRIEAPGIVANGYVATVLARSADSLTLGSPQSAPLTIAASRITRFEISRGSSRTEGAIRGVEWGTAIGALMGLAFLPAAHDCRTCTRQPSDASIVSQTAFGGAIWGAIIGAIAGREKWDRFDAAPRVTVAGDGRVALSLSRAW